MSNGSALSSNRPLTFRGRLTLPDRVTPFSLTPIVIHSECTRASSSEGVTLLPGALQCPQHASNRVYSGLISGSCAGQSSEGTGQPGQLPPFLSMCGENVSSNCARRPGSHRLQGPDMDLDTFAARNVSINPERIPCLNHPCTILGRASRHSYIYARIESFLLKINLAN